MFIFKAKVGLKSPRYVAMPDESGLVVAKTLGR